VLVAATKDDFHRLLSQGTEYQEIQNALLWLLFVTKTLKFSKRPSNGAKTGFCDFPLNPLRSVQCFCNQYQFAFTADSLARLAKGDPKML
jgi:hypothetical protein